MRALADALFDIDKDRELRVSVLTSAGKFGQQPVSARQWSAGFLPSADWAPADRAR